MSSVRKDWTKKFIGMRILSNLTMLRHPSLISRGCKWMKTYIIRTLNQKIYSSSIALKTRIWVWNSLTMVWLHLRIIRDFKESPFHTPSLARKNSLRRRRTERSFFSPKMTERSSNISNWAELCLNFWSILLINKKRGRFSYTLLSLEIRTRRSHSTTMRRAIHKQ